LIGAESSDIAVAFGDGGGEYGDAASHAISDDNNIAEDLGEAGSADGAVVDTASCVGSADIDQKPDLIACDDANVVGDAGDAASVRSASESCGDEGDNVIVCNASGTGGEVIATGNANDADISAHTEVKLTPNRGGKKSHRLTVLEIWIRLFQLFRIQIRLDAIQIPG
jgi:hypothetical protein